MPKIRITNATTKDVISKELDLKARLVAIRIRLGTWMTKDDAFLDKNGKSIASKFEQSTKVEEIEYTGDPKSPGIKIAKVESKNPAKSDPKKKPDPKANRDPKAGGNPVADREPKIGDDFVADGELKIGDDFVADREPKIGDDFVADGEPKIGDDFVADEESNAGSDPKDDDEVSRPAQSNDKLFNGGSLTPIEIPEYEWADDHVGLADGLKEGKPVREDKVTAMKIGQVRNLLKENRINLNNKKYGLTAAFVDNGDLVRAPYDAVQCTEVEVKPPDANRITNISFQYNEHISRLHRTTTTEGTADVGMPGIFRMESSYRNAVATRSDRRLVTEHKSYSHIIPKARVVFKDDKISLISEFVDKIREAVNAPQAGARAEKLLSVLERYGQFFASDMLLGGRLNYWTDKRLDDSFTAEQEQVAFQLATEARGKADGVDVEAGGSVGHSLTNDQKKIAISQASSLFFKLIGGNSALTSPENWIPTVAKYLNWRFIGFNAQSLVPIIDYLDDDLRAKCLKLLKNYFQDHLELQTTSILGLPKNTNQFGYDVDEKAKRIVTIEVNHGINIDGLRVTYELTDGHRKQTPWAGWRHGEHNDTVGPLPFDEDITSIEVGYRAVVRQLAFRTSRGRRFPAPGKYYGRGEDGEQLTYTTIQAPRICGIVGNHEDLIIGIGLRYYELTNDPRRIKSRNFLLEMEPYLFPLNISSPIEMTIPGILLAGKWRTENELNAISANDKRNTLITELNAHSKQKNGYFAAFKDDDLVGMGAVMVFLMAAGIRDKNWLKANTCDDHRNGLIAFLDARTGEPVSKLQGLTNQELVRWGFTLKGNAAAAIGAPA